MSRPADSWASLGATLARVLASPAPEWVTADARQAVTMALWHLARDARAAIEGRTTREAPGVLGAGHGSLARWRAAGGWLSGE